MSYVAAEFVLVYDAHPNPGISLRRMVHANTRQNYIPPTILRSQSFNPEKRGNKFPGHSDAGREQRSLAMVRRDRRSIREVLLRCNPASIAVLNSDYHAANHRASISIHVKMLPIGASNACNAMLGIKKCAVITSSKPLTEKTSLPLRRKRLLQENLHTKLTADSPYLRAYRECKRQWVRSASCITSKRT